MKDFTDARYNAQRIVFSNKETLEPILKQTFDNWSSFRLSDKSVQKVTF